MQSRFPRFRTLLPGVLVLSLAIPSEGQEFLGSVVEPSPQSQSVDTVRQVGTAMMSWLVGVASGDGQVPKREEEPVTIRLRSTPDGPVLEYQRISYEELATLLVPLYIQSLPETDAWGHPLQFALNSNILGSAVLAVRSPGQDGRYEDEPYEPRAFTALAWDRDIVWADGYFVRWPREPR